MKVLLQIGLVIEHRQGPSDVMVTPRLFAQPVEGIDHVGWIAVPANIGAASEQKVCRKALHIVEIMHVVQGLAACENLMAAAMHGEKVTENFGLKRSGDVHLAFPWLER